MNPFIKVIEYISGGLLFVVMVLITGSAISRYLFNSPLLDADDIARLLLLPAIFFGFASACRHNEHIRIDLIWERLSPAKKRCTDRIALVLTAAVVILMATVAVSRVYDIYVSHTGTYELRLPIWPAFALANLGMVFCAVVLLRAIFTRRNEDDPTKEQS